MSTDIGRRQFLIASSACALATAAVGPNLFAAGPREAPKRLAVGFAPIDETANVFAAAKVPSGDGAFISRGARITVSGTSGGDDANPLARRAVELVAQYSVFEGAERRTVPFRAWGCSRMTGCQGSPASFTVPVDDIQALTFTIETERGVPRGTASASRRDAITGSLPEVVALPVRLTVRSEDALKLVRGFYVIVPLIDNDAEPQWSRYELKTAGGRWALHDASGEPAGFEHFVLRIDYAS